MGLDRLREMDTEGDVEPDGDRVGAGSAPQRHRSPPHELTDFWTREGEDHKTMVDWSRDKVVSWKTHRSLSKRIRSLFHVRSVSKNEAIIRMGSVVYESEVGRWSSSCLVEDPPTSPQDIFRVVCADSKPQRPQVTTMSVSRRYKMI